MPIATRVGGALLALVIAAGASACAPTPTPSPLPTPTATTPMLSPEEQDLVNAEQAIVKLWAVVDRLTNDAQTSIQELDTVASGATRTMFQENLGKYRAAGWTGSGSSIVEHVSASALGVNAQGLSTWTVTACIDGSRTTLVDEQGQSVQGPPYRILHQSTVVQRSSAFLVAEDVAVGTC